ncbi:MAG: tryptophan--tRNA ligase [bacterium]|nr:tryptophan--tRNA ligase [bacterium]
MTNKKPVLVSGIQPTGRLHIGNYLGALKQFVELQNSGKYQCYFFVADLHALTENPSPKDLSQNIINLVIDFFAVGLDPKKSVIFQQSQIQSLQELKWVLGTLVPPGELLRMTAFKEKVLQALKPEEREKLTKEEFDKIVVSTNYGLVEYPILMAADILIFGGQFVPIGHDQLQHLELARTIARKFNNRFGKIFVEPRPLLAPTSRVMSLDDPTKKMSKSLPNGCLFLDDKPEDIRAKFRKAVTDSGSEIKFDEVNKPAISNLLMIYSEFSGLTIAQIEAKFKNKNYSQFKEALAELVISYFEPFNKKKKLFQKKIVQVKKQLTAGSNKAHIVAYKKIQEVKKLIGLIPHLNN